MAEFVGPGSLALRSPLGICAEVSCPRILSGPSTLAAASAAELTPKNPRRLKRSFSASPAIFTTLTRISQAPVKLPQPRYATPKTSALQRFTPAVPIAINGKNIVFSFQFSRGVYWSPENCFETEHVTATDIGRRLRFSGRICGCVCPQPLESRQMCPLSYRFGRRPRAYWLQAELRYRSSR